MPQRAVAETPARPSPQDLPAEIPCFIGGRRHTPAGERVAVYDPSRGAEVSRIAEADAVVVAEAVEAARLAFQGGEWSRAEVRTRQATLYRAAELVRRHADELAALESLCAGTHVTRSCRRQVVAAAQWLAYFGERLGSWPGQVFRQQPRTTTLVLHDPRGVAALFAPWNVPVGLALVKLAAALACGNSVVLKPSEQTPLATLRLVELLHEAGLPPGTLNLVNGRGAVTGAALAAAEGVDCISFTGGATAGRAVARAAAERFIPCLLELGGKSAFIVFPDVDLDAVADAAVLAAFGNNGQACLAGSRVLIHRDIAAEFRARLLERVAALEVGDPFDPDVDMGPISSEAHRRMLQSRLEHADGSGARLLCGGTLRSDLDPGWYMQPAVVEVDDPRHLLAQEELFGPIVTLLEFGHEDEAWRIANDTRYGLVNYVWTDSHARVNRAIDTLRAGTLLVNTTMVRELNAPFGGLKDSGLGSEGGDFSIRFFTQERAIVMSQDGAMPRA